MGQHLSGSWYKLWASEIHYWFYNLKLVHLPSTVMGTLHSFHDVKYPQNLCYTRICPTKVLYILSFEQNCFSWNSRPLKSSQSRNTHPYSHSQSVLVPPRRLVISHPSLRVAGVQLMYSYGSSPSQMVSCSLLEIPAQDSMYLHFVEFNVGRDVSKTLLGIWHFMVS